jgi:glycosyltransferase involved in cell wall biosynthesis
MSRPSHHLLITTDAVGGIWHYTQTLALGLAERGWQVTVLCLGPPPSGTARMALNSHHVELRLCEHPLDWMAASVEEIHAAGGTIARVAEEVGAQSLHLHSPSYAACRNYEVPVVAVSHSCLGTWWEQVRQGPAPPDFTWRILLHGEGLVRADRVICPTQAFAKQTAQYYGLPQVPHAVHNGRPEHTVAQASETSPVFAFTAGRLWDDAKNIATLDAAAPRTQLPIVAAGEPRGPHGQTRDLHAVRQLGQLDDSAMQRIFAQRPIYVAPALYEPFGLGILEAAQAGCALVLGDIETLRELWDGAAYFVPPRSVEAIAEALNHLQKDDAARDAVGAAARRRSKNYDAAAFIDATAKVHVELVRSRTKTAVSA